MLNVYITERNLFRSIDKKNEEYGNLFQAMEDVEDLRNCLGYAKISEKELKVNAKSLLKISESIKELEEINKSIAETTKELKEG